jgi:hypothetical protein
MLAFRIREFTKNHLHKPVPNGPNRGAGPQPSVSRALPPGVKTSGLSIQPGSQLPNVPPALAQERTQSHLSSAADLRFQEFELF